MQEKPRVGLVLMRTTWNACDRGVEIQKEFDADARTIIERLDPCFSIEGPFIIDSPDTLADCRKKLQNGGLDMVLLAFQTWADENLLVSLIEPSLGLPLVLWCFLPFRRFPHPATFYEVLRSTGSVSAFGALGALRNLRVPFLFTWGAADDPRLIDDLVVAGRAAQVRSGLQRARFGVLPSLGEGIHARTASETRMREDFGTQVEVIPVETYLRALEKVTQEEVAAFLTCCCEQYQVVDVSEADLKAGARVSLGLARLAADYRLNVLAVNGFPPELEDAIQIRPSLYPEVENDGHGPLYQSEADMGAAAANFILSRLTGSPTMFVEFWYWNEAMNQLVGGHTGLQNPATASPGQAWISRDYVLCSRNNAPGVQFQMIARSGRVTIFQLRATPDGWQAIAATGVTLESRPVAEGIPHMLLRLDASIDHFLNSLIDTGASQHWIMAYGSVLHELDAFCQMANIPLLMLRS